MHWYFQILNYSCSHNEKLYLETVYQIKDFFVKFYVEILLNTRIYSSRMRTVRNSSHQLLGGLHPQEQTPPRADPPEQTPQSRPPQQASSRHPPAGTPRADTPLEQTPLEQTPSGRHPPSRHPLEQTPPPKNRHLPWEQAPPAARHAGIPPAMHTGIAQPPCEQNHRHM